MFASQQCKGFKIMLFFNFSVGAVDLIDELMSADGKYLKTWLI